MLVHAAVPSAIVERPRELFRTDPLILADFRGTAASRAWRTVEAFDNPAPRARPLSHISPSLHQTDGRGIRFIPPWKRSRPRRSIPLGEARGGGRWSKGVAKWNDDARPPANVGATIILLIHIACQVTLQDDWTEVVADKAAHRELALFQIARNWRAQIAGIETDPARLPLPEFMGCGQIHVDEVRITSVVRERR